MCAEKRELKSSRDAANSSAVVVYASSKFTSLCSFSGKSRGVFDLDLAIARSVSCKEYCGANEVEIVVVPHC